MNIRQPGEPAIRDNDGTLLALTDWRGNTYRIGDTVMYCISAGRGQMMAEGRIVQFREEPAWRWNLRTPEPGDEPNYHTHGGTPYIRQREDYVVYGVQVLTSRTSGRWNNEARTRPAWVNEMNITALPILAEGTDR